MPAPSVTYTFANSTTADATQVNQNFTDMINSLSDGTKDLSIGALTCAGAATLNGAVTLGNGSVDDITVTGSLASSIPIKTTYSYDIGAATLGLRKLYLGASDSAARSIAIGAGAVSASYTMTLPTAVPVSAKSVMTFDTSGVASFESRATRSTAAKTTTYLATLADDVILCDATSGSFTVTLPAAASSAGKLLLIKRTDGTAANIVTIDGNASETIDGVVTRKLATQYERLEILCDGSNWTVLSHDYNQAWVAFTPTGSWAADLSYAGFYRRTGDSLDVQISLRTSASQTGGLTLNIPNSASWTIDTAKIPAPSGGQGAGDDRITLGQLVIRDATASAFNGTVNYNSTTSVIAMVTSTGSTYAGNAQVSNTVPMAWTTNDELGCWFRVPITNFEG